MKIVRYIYNGVLVLESTGNSDAPLAGEFVTISSGSSSRTFVVDYRMFLIAPSDVSRFPLVIEIYLKD